MATPKKFIDFLAELSYSITRAISWVLLTSFFSLIQVFFVFCVISLRKDSDLSLEELYRNGSLLFFSAGLVTNISIDYCFSRADFSLPKIAIGLVYGIFPVFVLIMTIFVYSACHFIDKNQIDMELLRKYQITILIVSLVQTVVGKTLMFFGEKK